MRKDSLCGMKTQHMQMKRNFGLAWSLTALALLGPMGLAFGQGEPLSMATTQPIWVDPTVPHFAVPVVERRPSHAPARLTDDGWAGDPRTVTTQLVFAFESGHPRSLAVDVLDEHGRVVYRCTLNAKAGRNALAMDVSGLQQGRYVARITEGQAGRLVRFRR